MNFIHDLVGFGDPRDTVFHLPSIGGRMTYQEFGDTVDLYSRYFYATGIRQGDNIGLISKNSPDFACCYMALSKLGAVVVPINSHFIGREIAYIIQDAGIKYLVTQVSEDFEQELRNKYGYKPNVAQVIISQIRDQALNMSLLDVPKPTITQASPCVIIYTSGTTGNPKGAVLSHANLIANVRQVFESHRIPVGRHDNVLVILPMYHAFAWTCSVLGALYEGASMTTVDTLNFKDILQVITSTGVTTLFAVPSIYNLFATYAAKEDFAKIRLAVSGGATLPQAVADKYEQKFGHRIMEGYGLSEASPVVCVNRPEKIKIGSIGPVLPDVTALIMDESGNVLPDGERGELVIKGPNVMMGYYNLPKETTEVLRGGWLHTGDVAFKDDDGYLYIVDRIKDIVLINGENVYPREIEECLYAHPDISEAAVVGLPDDKREHLVYAVIVVKEGAVFDARAIRLFLHKSLATFKIPKEIVEFKILPKTSTGKISKLEIKEQLLARRKK